MDEFYDIALRDFGLLIAALALARLASAATGRTPAASNELADHRRSSNRGDA
jgi:hypothetical protein